MTSPITERRPMTVQIALQCANDDVLIMTFITHEFASDGTIRRHMPATVENIEREITKYVDQVTTRSAARKALGAADPDNGQLPLKGWKPLDPTTLPDRTYRNAWRTDGNSIDHSMEKVRTIALERIREARKPVLTQLDATWMRAIGQGKTVEAALIEQRRQELRDRPAIVADALINATTPEQVTALATLE